VPHNRRVTQPIYLVRHGQSEWNVLGLTQGQTMHPRLTERGRAQAAESADRIVLDLAGLPCPRVLSSDLARASETAEIIAARLEAVVDFDKRLREQALGAHEGQATGEGSAMFADAGWEDPDLAVGGGETFREVYERVGSLLAEASGPLVLVSHGVTIRAAYAWLHGLPVHANSIPRVENGAVLRVDARRWLGDWRRPLAGSNGA
jgi:broad specificity phosphatase PhoE